MSNTQIGQSGVGLGKDLLTWVISKWERRRIRCFQSLLTRQIIRWGRGGNVRLNIGSNQVVKMRVYERINMGNKHKRKEVVGRCQDALIRAINDWPSGIFQKMQFKTRAIRIYNVMHLSPYHNQIKRGVVSFCLNL